MSDSQFPSVVEHIRRLARRPDAASPADRELLRGFCSGTDPEAFTALVCRHGPLVLRVCRRVLGQQQDAEDAFQATFLILARRASSLRTVASLAAWLHGVAYRVALQAKRNAARRRLHEARAAEAVPTSAAAEVSWREVQAILHEEIEGLPERLRAPFLLCCVEGLGRAEAARQLGLKEGTVWSRLAQARKQLQARLRRRGIDLAAVLAAAAFTGEAGRAALSPALVAAVVRAAGKAGASVASPGVTALVEGVLEGMAVSKMKIGLGLLVAVGLLAAGAGTLAQQVRGPKPQARTGPEKQIRTEAQADPLPANVLLRLGTTRFRPGAPVQSMAFLPGDRVVVSTGFRGIYFWDAATGKELRRIRVSEDGAGPFALSEDGKLLAAVCDRVIRVWDVGSGREMGKLSGRAGRLGFSHDGRTLATLDDQGILCLWSWREGKQLRRMGTGHYNILGVAFSADDRTVLSWDMREMRLWEAGSGRLRQAIPYPNAGCTYLDRVVMSADGKLAAHSVLDQPVRLFETATGKEIGRMEAGQVRVLGFTPDGRGLLLSERQKEGAALWDIARGKEVYRINTGRQAAFSRDGKVLALAGDAIRLYDAATGKRLDPCTGQSYSSDRLIFSPDGRQLAGRSFDDGTVHVWEAQSGKLLHVFGKPGREDGHGYSLAFAPDGTKLAWADWGGRVYLVDPRSGQELRQWSVNPKIDAVESVAFSPDGRALSTVSYQAGFPGRPQVQLVQMWDLATGKEVARHLRGFSDSINPRLLSPDGAAVLLSEEGRLLLRDVRKGRELAPLQTSARAGRISWPTFSGDSRTLAACVEPDVGSGIRLWETASGKECARITPPKPQPGRLALSPTGRVLAWASPETIALWDLATGREVARLRGPGLPVHSLAFSPDGKTLASAHSDTTILIWDLRPHLPPRALPVADTDLESLWTDLASSEGTRAYRAVWSLVASGERGVRLLRRRLQPSPTKEGALRRLIAELDSPEFKVRQAAFEQLKEHRLECETLLREALAGDPSAEARRSIERLLRLSQRSDSPELLRQVWAVAVLEYQGTPEARRLLQTLADGPPQGLLGREARAALGRLAHGSSLADASGSQRRPR
jgi:RNA polymerase sigma factor (sigma-70 family)